MLGDWLGEGQADQAVEDVMDVIRDAQETESQSIAQIPALSTSEEDERIVDGLVARATEPKPKAPGMGLRAHLEMAIGLSMVNADPAVTDALRDVVAIMDGALECRTVTARRYVEHYHRDGQREVRLIVSNEDARAIRSACDRDGRFAFSLRATDCGSVAGKDGEP